MAAILFTNVPQEIIDKIPNVIGKKILLLSIHMRNIDRIKRDIWSPNWFDKEYIRNAIYDILDEYTHIIIQMWKIQKNPLLYEEIFKRFSQCSCCKRHQHYRPSIRRRYEIYHPRYYAQLSKNLFYQPNYNTKRQNEVKFRQEFGFGFVRSWFDSDHNESSCKCCCRTFCRSYIGLKNYFKDKIITEEDCESAEKEMEDLLDQWED